MRWKYQLIEKSERIVIYAYSRESDELDGRISYDKKIGKAQLIKPCKGDVGSKMAERSALAHFDTVISEGFPESRYVCCG